MGFLKKKNIEKDIVEIDNDDELENNIPDILDNNDDFNDDIIDDFGSGSGSIAERNPELLRQLMNFQPFLKTKINGWLGLIWDEDKKTYVQNIYVVPMMNMRCANWCSTFLETYTRDTNIIANIDRDTFYNLMSDMTSNVIINIYTRMDEFAIKSIGDAKRITEELLHSAEIMMCSIGGGKTADILQATVNRSEHVNVQSEQTQSNMVLNRPSERKKGINKFLNKMMGDN